jgi:hypothetical protein
MERDLRIDGNRVYTLAGNAEYFTSLPLLGRRWFGTHYIVLPISQLTHTSTRPLRLWSPEEFLCRNADHRIAVSVGIMTSP